MIVWASVGIAVKEQDVLLVAGTAGIGAIVVAALALRSVARGRPGAPAVGTAQPA